MLPGLCSFDALQVAKPLSSVTHHPPSTSVCSPTWQPSKPQHFLHDGRSITQARLIKALPSGELQPVPLPRGLGLEMKVPTLSPCLGLPGDQPQALSHTSRGIIIQKTLITLEIPRVFRAESQETETKIKYLFFLISQLGSPTQPERVAETGALKVTNPGQFRSLILCFLICVGFLVSPEMPPWILTGQAKCESNYPSNCSEHEVGSSRFWCDSDRRKNLRSELSFFTLLETGSSHRE